MAGTTAFALDPSRAASARPTARPSSEKSMPVNRLAGSAAAITLIAWPLPQPIVGDVRARGAAAPAGRRPSAGSRRRARCRTPRRSSPRHQRVEPRVLAVGQPTAGAEAADHLCSTSASSGMNCATRARLSGPRHGSAPRHGGVAARTSARLGRSRRSVRHDPTDPLPHVAFVESCGVGDLSRWWPVGVRPACRTGRFGVR